MEFVLLVNRRASVQHEVPFRLIAAETYDVKRAAGEIVFDARYKVVARGTWEFVLAAWQELPDHLVGETLFTHLIRARRDAELAHAKPFKGLIHVVIEGLDAADPSIEIVQMFWSGDESDFERKGFSFKWRGKRLVVRRLSSNKSVAEFYGYDVTCKAVVGVHDGRANHYRFTSKLTQRDAEQHAFQTHPDVVRGWYKAWDMPCPFDAPISL